MPKCKNVPFPSSIQDFFYIILLLLFQRAIFVFYILCFIFLMLVISCVFFFRVCMFVRTCACIVCEGWVFSAPHIYISQVTVVILSKVCSNEYMFTLKLVVFVLKLCFCCQQLHFEPQALGVDSLTRIILHFSPKRSSVSTVDHII